MTMRSWNKRVVMGEQHILKIKLSRYKKFILRLDRSTLKIDGH